MNGSVAKTKKPDRTGCRILLRNHQQRQRRCSNLDGVASRIVPELRNPD